MKTPRFLFLLLAACGSAGAQVPAANPMPDGSRDQYLGIGAVAAPRYEGAAERRLAPWPVLQIESGSGVFVAGLSAGMHLSAQPGLEYGPLLALDPGRDAAGTHGGAGGVDGSGILTPGVAERRNRLEGMERIGARLQGGVFFNAYLDPGLRLTNTVLAGAGAGRDGLAWRIGLQQLAADLGAHHRVSVAGGATIVNRAWNAGFFGVTKAEAARSGNPAFAPAGGVKDLYASVRWNWALTPGAMLVTQLQATRLVGDARRSPLVERPTNATASAALAYRF
jgi:outer membrane protein